MNRPGYWKTYYQDNKEKKDAQSRKWALDNPESIQDTQKRWEMRNPGRRKAISRKRTLRIKNLTAEQYDAMVVLQGNRCAICDCTDTGRWKHWHIDQLSRDRGSPWVAL